MVVDVGVRIETDLLGQVAVPADALYGAQTQRALANFPLGRQRTVGSYPGIVTALLLVKKAAALTNREIGQLEPQAADAIISAADRLLAEPQPDIFPLHHLHGGGGTSANMCANEVLANLGEELFGGRRGEYRWLHPNDHVNLNQSTNDVYPTACRMAVIVEWPELRAGLIALAVALEEKGGAYRDVPRLSRTCLQDAVATTWGDFFGAQSAFIRRSCDRLETAVDALHWVNLGGTIVGRLQDAPEAYRQRIVPVLCEVTGDDGYHQAPDLIDAAQNADDLAAVSAQLDLLARGLIKIAKDFRILGSGPEGGLGELRMPAVQPGSSCMPGKVNPVMAEFLIQVAFNVMGNHLTCSSCLDHAELDLNVWESAMVFSILESFELLTDGAAAFAERCVRGLVVDVERNVAHANALIPFLTEQSKILGYARVTVLCRQADGDPVKIRSLMQAEKSSLPANFI
jgi:aspartate ammonia-lyase